MLKVRLARLGRKKRPFFRIVVTEHTKPAHAGFQDILGWFDPLTKEKELNVEALKAYIAKGAQPTPRVAKIAFAMTKDAFFEKYFEKKDITRAVKNPDKYE